MSKTPQKKPNNRKEKKQQKRKKTKLTEPSDGYIPLSRPIIQNTSTEFSSSIFLDPSPLPSSSPLIPTSSTDILLTGRGDLPNNDLFSAVLESYKKLEAYGAKNTPQLPTKRLKKGLKPKKRQQQEKLSQERKFHIKSTSTSTTSNTSPLNKSQIQSPQQVSDTEPSIVENDAQNTDENEKNCPEWQKYGKCFRTDCPHLHSLDLQKQIQRKNRPVVCRFFKTSSCKNLQCPYSHNLKDEACYYFFQSKTGCKLGNACEFSHEDGSLLIGKGGVPCKFWMAGKCKNDGSCPYLHSTEPKGIKNITPTTFDRNVIETRLSSNLK